MFHRRYIFKWLSFHCHSFVSGMQFLPLLPTNQCLIWMKPDFTTLKFSMLNTSLDDENFTIFGKGYWKKSRGVVIFLEGNHLGKLLNLNDQGILGRFPYFSRPWLIKLVYTTRMQKKIQHTPHPTPLLDLLLSEHLRPGREDEHLVDLFLLIDYELPNIKLVMVSVMCSFVLTFILTFFVILVLWCSSPLLFLPLYSLSSVFWTLGSWKSFQLLLLEAAGIASSMLLGDSFGDETSTNALFLWTNSRFRCSNVCFGRLPLLNLWFTGQAQKPHQVKLRIFASRMSAAPLLEEAARLPCFTIRT